MCKLDIDSMFEDCLTQVDIRAYTGKNILSRISGDKLINESYTLGELQEIGKALGIETMVNGYPIGKTLLNNEIQMIYDRYQVHDMARKIGIDPAYKSRLAITAEINNVLASANKRVDKILGV